MHLGKGYAKKVSLNKGHLWKWKKQISHAICLAIIVTWYLSTNSKHLTYIQITNICTCVEGLSTCILPLIPLPSLNPQRHARIVIHWWSNDLMTSVIHGDTLFPLKECHQGWRDETKLTLQQTLITTIKLSNVERPWKLTLQQRRVWSMLCLRLVRYRCFFSHVQLFMAQPHPWLHPHKGDERRCQRLPLLP